MRVPRMRMIVRSADPVRASFVRCTVTVIHGRDATRWAQICLPSAASGPHPGALTTPERKPPTRGAVAGLMLVAALLLCGAIGALIGALVGGLAFFLIAGVVAGFVLGIVAVRARFPDL